MIRIREFGGRGGIRTHGTFYRSLDFESSAFDRAQPPFLLLVDQYRDLKIICFGPKRIVNFLSSTQSFLLWAGPGRGQGKIGWIERAKANPER